MISILKTVAISNICSDKFEIQLHFQAIHLCNSLIVSHCLRQQNRLTEQERGDFSELAGSF